MRDFFKSAIEAVIRSIDTLADCVDVHFEGSVKVSQDEMEALVSRLRKNAPSQGLKTAHASETSARLAELVRPRTARYAAPAPIAAHDRWFESEETCLGGRIKRQSDSFFRLRAFIATVDSEELAGLLQTTNL